jgi:hypothetical protein
MYVPNATSRMVTPGAYYAELDGDTVERESKWDQDKKYFQIPLLLTPKAGGQPVRFLWFCQPDSDVWTDALIAIGGRRNISGGVDAPAHPEGRRFLVTIIKHVGKDGRERRQVASAERIDGAVEEGPPTGEDPDPDTGIPF